MDKKKRLLQKAMAQKTGEQRAKDMVNQDYMEAPADQYDASGMAEAVNAVTTSGEPLRVKYDQKSEERMGMDKKAHEEMIDRQAQEEILRKKALLRRKK